MSWKKVSDGASNGFEEFINVMKGKKNIEDAMIDIKKHFNEKRKKTS
ncbi:hypothetical protein [Salipaludibacillus sp. CF4.18]